ncbi:MAG: purine-nucleoside phosphorylase [candidate division WOR-3 bacterium]|nr:purine-nucleoside phosphorylase [candidate division WOR-3 bacterium]
MMPIHLRANKGDYAQTVLVVGDPGRAEFIAGILDNANLVNKNRGLLGFTGFYRGKKISVQTTGMGCPSAAIVVEELIQLDVKRIIRIGTCGGIAAHINALDMICAMTSAPHEGTTFSYLNGEPVAPYATFKILKLADDISKKLGLNLHFGGIASVDVFYSPDPEYVAKLRKKGILAVEMETSLIYYLCNRSNLETASFLLVSDVVGRGEEFTKFVSDAELKSGMERLIKLVLEVCYMLD